MHHSKMPHVEMVKAAHTDEDDKPAEPAGTLNSSGTRDNSTSDSMQ